MTFGYLGPKGTFTQSALGVYLSRHTDFSHVATEGFSTISDLFFELGQGRLDAIVIPFENSIGGSVNDSLDLLIQYDGVFIQEEIVLKINQCLLAQKGRSIDEITDVVSHSQALSQSQSFLRLSLGNAQRHVTSSTAKAAQLVADHDTARLGLSSQAVIAAIGNKELASVYDLDVLAEGINDTSYNFTRFVVVSRAKAPRTGHDKTSLLFSTLKDKPGGLVTVLTEFSKRDLNLTRISSHPMKTFLGDYLFFIDFEGHIEDPLVAEAVNAVKDYASYFKWIGSYRQDGLA